MNELYRMVKGKNANRILENFFSLAIVRSLTMLIPLITLPYILSTIGLEKYGIITMALSLANYISPVLDFSFSITATREISKNRDNAALISLIYSRVLFTQVIILVVSLTILCALIFAIPRFIQDAPVFFFAFLMLVGQVLFPDWYFQGIEKMKIVSIINVLTRLSFAFCVFLFIKNEDDYIWYTLILGSGSVIAGITAQLYVFMTGEVKLSKVPIISVFREIKCNFGIFLNQFFPQLYNNSTTFLLGIFTTNEVVGVYGAAKNVINVAGSFVHIMSRVVFPYLNRASHHFNKIVRVILIMTGIGCTLIMLTASVISSYFSIDSDLAPLIICILAVSLFFLAVYMCYGTNFFIVKGMDGLVIKNTVISSLIGFASAFPLIIYFGAIGAALNLLFARALMGGGLYYRYRSYKRESYEKTEQ